MRRDKRGSIDRSLPSILHRLAIDPDPGAPIDEKGSLAVSPFSFIRPKNLKTPESRGRGRGVRQTRSERIGHRVREMGRPDVRRESGASRAHSAHDRR
jgi:hypothetical protein